MLADEDSHRHAVENLDQADALLFGRVTDELLVIQEQLGIEGAPTSMPALGWRCPNAAAAKCIFQQRAALSSQNISAPVVRSNIAVDRKGARLAESTVARIPKRLFAGSTRGSV
jgi:hypothetical protein